MTTEIRKGTQGDIEWGDPATTATSPGGHVGYKIPRFFEQAGAVSDNMNLFALRGTFGHTTLVANRVPIVINPADNVGSRYWTVKLNWMPTQDGSGDKDYALTLGWNLTGSAPYYDSNYPSWGMSFESRWANNFEWYLERVFSGGPGLPYRRPLGVYASMVDVYAEIDMWGKVSIGTAAGQQHLSIGDGYNDGSIIFYHSGANLKFNYNNANVIYVQDNTGLQYHGFLAMSDQNVWQIGGELPTQLYQALGVALTRLGMAGTPHSTLTVGGSVAIQTQAYEGNTTLGEEVSMVLWLPYDPGYTLKLPSLATNKYGRTIFVKNHGNQTANVIPFGSPDKIDGADTYPLAVGDSVTVVAHGTNWFVIGSHVAP